MKEREIHGTIKVTGRRQKMMDEISRLEQENNMLECRVRYLEARLSKYVNKDGHRSFEVSE